MVAFLPFAAGSGRMRASDRVMSSLFLGWSSRCSLRCAGLSPNAMPHVLPVWKMLAVAVSVGG